MWVISMVACTAPDGPARVGFDRPPLDVPAPTWALHVQETSVGRGRPGPPPRDTGSEAPSGPRDTGIQPQPLLQARLAVDVDEGQFPLAVSLDASGSDLGSGTVRYEWAFGDGASAVGDPARVHTYIGRGDFDVQLTLVDELTGATSTATVQIEVDEPDCPREDPSQDWGTLDGDLDAVSGIAESRRVPGLFWLEQDNDDELAVVDSSGRTISEHDLPRETDREDIEIAIDPVTGVSMLFVAETGDNHLERDHVEVWVVEEPDPWTDSDVDPLRIELVYPDGPHDVETLVVDPLTLDVFLVTKELDDQKVYAKRAPHDDEGPFVLEDLGAFDELDMRATGGAVSPDGSRIVIRDYSDTVRMWFRDGYQSFERALEGEPCRIDIYDDNGEGITFTDAGSGIVTIEEGDRVPMRYVPF